MQFVQLMTMEPGDVVWLLYIITACYFCVVLPPYWVSTTNVTGSIIWNCESSNATLSPSVSNATLRPSDEPVSSRSDWEAVDKVLLAALRNKTFPGCVAAVGSRDGFIYSASFGNFTYGDPAPISRSNPPMTNEVNITCSAVASVQTRTNMLVQIFCYHNAEIWRLIPSEVRQRSGLLYDSGSGHPGYELF